MADSASDQSPELATDFVIAPPVPPSEAKVGKKRSSSWIGTSNPNIYWRPRTSRDYLSPLGLPLPPIRARARRPHAIHIIAYPSGFVPYDLRPGYNAARAAAAAAAAAKKRRSGSSRSPTSRLEAKTSRFGRSGKKKRERSGTSPVRESWGRVGFGKIFAPFHSSQQATRTRPERSPSRAQEALPSTHNEEPMSRPLSMVEAMLAAQNPSAYRSFARPAPKSTVTSNVVEISKPVATGSGVTCSIILAESHVFLAGFDHDGRNRHEVQGGTALLRGKLQLNVTKNVKLKAVTLKLLGKARTEWPEGIPPAKQETFEEESLRTQVLTFFNAMHDGWETDYGNQCTYSLKSGSNNSSRTNLALQMSRGGSSSSQALGPTDRNLILTREGRRMSIQSAQSRTFGKDDSVVSSTQLKGYRVFYPGTYDYSFELPIDHHQLETTKLQFGSVRWELQATVERAGAFKPNLHGAKEVSIIRVPDQLSLETTEPISISRRWEDQLHYDIIISGKSFPIGGRIPIAFKLTPLAKVQIHKLKVYVSESIEYWTNDRRVTRRDPGRKILLLEKTAGKPLEDAYAASELRILSGGELDASDRRDARQQAVRRREAEASTRGRNSAPRPLPEPTDNLLGDLDLGLESFWGPTEIEANVQMPTCEMMARNKDLKLHPDCSWKNVNVYHWIKIVLRISRADPEDPTGTRRRHFEISIDSPFTVLNCKATQANTSLPEYSDATNAYSSGSTSTRACGCPDAAIITSGPSPAASTLTLDMAGPSNIPSAPQAAHLASAAAGSTAAVDGTPAPGYTETVAQSSRPIHLLRAPSYNPPAFDAEQPPPPIELVTQATAVSAASALEPVMTPPPHYDVVIGTPSVDGLADYFSRLADYGYDAAVEDEEDSDSNEEEDAANARPRLVERHSGRVNVSNPRTPGPRRAPSRSMDIQRPELELTLPVRRGTARGPSS